jgi:GxxExxY protein
MSMRRVLRTFSRRRPTDEKMEQEDRKTGRFGDGSDDVIAACIEVHRHLGPGLLESAYEACLCQELTLRGLAFVRQATVPIDYKGHRVDCGYRVDLIVEATILVEIKAIVGSLQPVHVAQVLTYLKLTDLRIGLLVNFNEVSLRHGLRRPTRRDAGPSP